MATFAPSESTAAAATRSLAGLTDAELVAEVRRGCDRAFEHLYERYHRRIAAYIYGMVGDYGRAEDIAQDVFMSTLRRMRDTDRPITFKPWVYEIAKNACIDQFRRARRSEEVSYDAEEGLGAADYGRLVTLGPTPDVAVDQKMAIDHLRGAFGGLSETHHQILVMRELEGLSYREIGERLGMSRPSVESTLFRARRRLGEEYEQLVSGERCVRVQDIIAAAAAGAPGARDQRRLAAHLAHCQACRRHAHLAGLDFGAVAARRGARAKIAALIPLPAFLRRRWFGGEVAPVANHHVSTLAQVSAQLGSVVGTDPGLVSWTRAAAAAATLTVAGVAGGAAVSDHTRTDLGLRPAPDAAGAPELRATAGPTPTRATLAPARTVTGLGRATVPASAPEPAGSALAGTSPTGPARPAAGGTAPSGHSTPAGSSPSAGAPSGSGSPAVLDDAIDPSSHSTGPGRPGGSQATPLDPLADGARTTATAADQAAASAAAGLAEAQDAARVAVDAATSAAAGAVDGALPGH